MVASEPPCRLHEVLHWLVTRARAQGKLWQEISAATDTNARNEWQNHQRWLDRRGVRETDDAPDHEGFRVVSPSSWSGASCGV